MKDRKLLARKLPLSMPVEDRHSNTKQDIVTHVGHRTDSHLAGRATSHPEALGSLFGMYIMILSLIQEEEMGWRIIHFPCSPPTKPQHIHNIN